LWTLGKNRHLVLTKAVLIIHFYPSIIDPVNSWIRLIFARLSGLVYFIIFPLEFWNLFLTNFVLWAEFTSLYYYFAWRVLNFRASSRLWFFPIELLARENLSSAHRHSILWMPRYIFVWGALNFSPASQPRENVVVAVAFPASSQSLNRTRSSPNPLGVCCIYTVQYSAFVL